MILRNTFNWFLIASKVKSSPSPMDLRPLNDQTTIHLESRIKLIVWFFLQMFARHANQTFAVDGPVEQREEFTGDWGGWRTTGPGHFLSRVRP